MTDIEYKQKRLKLKEFVKTFTQMSRYRGLMSSTVSIPVVVHIVRGANDPYISDEQVEDQIKALNEDFSMNNVEVGFPYFKNNSRLNTDDTYEESPAPTRIRFGLAKRTPDCEATGGIIRTSTSKTEFNARVLANGSLDMSDVEKVTIPPEGQKAWPRDQYLNIWVCNFTVEEGGIREQYSGYAAFPGERPDFDGVIINSVTFGRHKIILNPPETENLWALPPDNNRGRSLTHEVGHWLNLYHIACDYNSCSDSDLVLDTPNQKDQTHFCPYYGSSENKRESRLTCSEQNFLGKVFECSGFPHPTCTTEGGYSNPGNSRGDMFVNIMDYTRDMCRFMFTAGQARRMEATLNGPRHSLLASDGLIPPFMAGSHGIWIRDSPEDFGDEPDIYSQSLCDSDDIWVNGPYPFIIYEHVNPHKGRDCTVHVRVRNSSCKEIGSRVLKLYWAYATTGLGWPHPWNDDPGSMFPMGGLIGAQNIGPVGPHGSKVLSFDWVPPVPNNKKFSIYPHSAPVNYCFLARIIDPGMPDEGMSFPEGPDLWKNIRNNNKIAMKNLIVAQVLEGDLCEGMLIVGSRQKYVIPDGGPIMHRAEIRIKHRAEIRPMARIRLQFSVPGSASELRVGSILDWGEVYVDLGKELFMAWEATDMGGIGIEACEGNVIRILRSNAWIDLMTAPEALHAVRLRFKRAKGSPEGYYVFHFDAVQQERVAGELVPVGGQRFAIKTFRRGRPIE